MPILIFLTFLLTWISGAAIAQNTNEPELSADEPISYMADQSLLVAKGNAVYSDGRVRVVADEIRFHREEGRIEATGNVSLTRDGMRLVSDWIKYNTETRQFECGPFRAGYPPFFMEGDGFQGTPDEIELAELSLFVREPVTAAPKLTIGSSRWIPEDSFRAKGIDLRFPLIGAIPLPSLDYNEATSAMTVSGELGYRSSLGAYGRSHFLYPFLPKISLGANLDFYTERGILFGPAMEYRSKKSDSRWKVVLNSGWIRDHNSQERGLDFLNQPISRERGFFETRVFADFDRTLQINSRLFYLSDSEILRDFRPDLYFPDFQPDSFLEFNWINDTIALNAFARAQVNDFYGLVERLPQVRLEGLPQKSGETPLITQWSLDFANLRPHYLFQPPAQNGGFAFGRVFLPSAYANRLPDLQTQKTIQRIDANARITYPIIQNPALQISAIAGAKWTHYNDSLSSDGIDRWVGEIGLDAAYSLARTWQLDANAWNVSELRHIVSPVLKYRQFLNGKDYRNEIRPIDTFVYNPSKPVIDLFNLRHIDDLTNLHVLRLGIENYWETKNEDGETRRLASLNFYEDIVFSDELDSDEAFYIEASIHPTEWLRLDWEQKIRAENLQTEATFFRAAVHSADLWEVAGVVEYLEGSIEQYGIDAAYRLTERNILATRFRYDARLESFTLQEYGLRRRFANVWEFEVYVSFNDNNNRDDNTNFGIRVRLLDF